MRFLVFVLMLLLTIIMVACGEIHRIKTAPPVVIPDVNIDISITEDEDTTIVEAPNCPRYCYYKNKYGYYVCPYALE